MKKNYLLKIKAGGALLVLVLAFFVTNIQPVRAFPIEVIADVPAIAMAMKETIGTKILKVLGNIGAKLLGTTVRNTLNRLALDAAKRVASSGEGQKPTYTVSELGGYWKNLGDAAAGDFIDSIGDDWGVDLCTPPDANLKGKISLGLVQTLAPAAPDCKITNILTNYSSAYEKFAAMKDGSWTKALQVSFDPGGSELSGALSLFGKTLATSTKASADAKDKSIVTQGWVEKTNIAGKLLGLPNGSEKELDTMRDTSAKGLLYSTGNILVDASNTFLNQLAYEGFQRVMREISKGKSDGATFDATKLKASGFESLIQYGESIVGEKFSSVIKPRFDVRSDYSILSDLASCVDKNNPSPASCVIDDKFSQAISEKLTVGDALKKDYLHKDWLISGDSKSDSTYTLRSASILRKYRIVPVGWEQAISLAVAKGYNVTFEDLVSCFKDDKGPFSSGFPEDSTWCRGLVDPNWVLKAPTNSCAKQGYGNQLIGDPIESKDANGLATLSLSRAADYCADDQSCIKEKTDGSCELYGYCNEEKRTWKFGSDSCEPVYNTCQTFTSVTDKQTASFLENTLDYSTCDQNNSGCKQYSYNGVYVASTNKITWDENYSIFFNNKAVSCDASNEGCTKLLRGKPGWGWEDVNYIMDANFDLNEVGATGTLATTTWRWPITKGVGTIVNDDGSKALSIEGPSESSLASTNSNNLLPKNLVPISGWSYTLSADVKLDSGAMIVMGLGGEQVQTSSNTWTTISTTTNNTSNLNFSITGVGQANVKFSVRNLKLTPNNSYLGFSNYAAFPIYEKLLPNYLESSCYTSPGNYTLKDNFPTVCDKFARKCNRNEVGCELFTSVKDIFAVAAKANVNDYCDESCVGYNTYLAKASYFYGTSADNLIPNNSAACNAENVGCSSFTNLDAATSGGESVEYYTKVRQCIKPDAASCGDFYSWDNAQLKVMSLKKDKDVEGSPAVVNNTNADCSDIYNLPITDPRYNPECREFYSKGGKITYHLISNTVSCSDDCRAYRLNEKNIDKTALDQDSCTSNNLQKPDKYWDASQSACYVCQNGGVWDLTQKACLYKVIPSEGTTCTAESVGCREYNGNNGNSLRLAATYDFETGVDGFTGSMVTQSPESTVKNGHSLSITGSASVDASDFAKKDSAYVIKFMAKSNSNSNTGVTLSFANSNNEISPFKNVVVSGGNTWRVYEANIEKLDHEVIDEILKIEANGSIIIDNIIINEITDKYYLIQGSSQIPGVCYFDMSEPGIFKGPNHNLGCAAYTDRAGTTHNLRQFSELCQNSAVGCEQMIQTNNSSSYYSYDINLTKSDKTVVCEAGTPGCVEVKGAEAIYAVFDPSKQCNSADTGCSRFGYLKTVANTNTWVDSYKKNLPDTYVDDINSPLCRSYEVGCDAWTYSNGSSISSVFFKTPGLNTCVFKDNKWYKTQIKRCDINSDGKITDTDNENVGDACLTDSDCGAKKCITDTNDYECTVNYLKTMGFGGVGGSVATPNGVVGLCNAQSAGCSEYIDPVSKYVNNLIQNPIAQKIESLVADKWTATTLYGDSYTQQVSVKPNKLYILQVDGDDTVTIAKFSETSTGDGGIVNILGANNNLSTSTATTSTSSVMFNTGINTYLNVYRHSTTTDLDSPAATISIKEAIVNYQPKNNIDASSCNGLVNTDNGCILFNARTQEGRSGLNKNIFNATLTTEGSSPSACGAADTNCFNNANTVIKVSPDRICSRWLSCQTYTEDPVTREKTCYKMGECSQLNGKNGCDNLLAIDNTTRDIKNSQNATGYALLNNWYIGAMKEVGQNTDAHFDFESSSVNLTCRRDIDVDKTPALNTVTVKNSACSFNINESLVLGPANSPTNYPAHGKGFLKVLNYYQISPLSNNSSIPLYTNQDYYINYLVNTNGSSANAKLIITNNPSSGVPVAKFTATSTAPNGWERKINKFRISTLDGKKTATTTKLYLTSTTNNLTTGYVYFDDINIEPVLQTGNDSYVPKDCRLYPGENSTSCLSTNNNVIKDGLFGYCLQYDPMNPGVCLMWYPVDKISPITRSNQSSLGYSGKFPLYYCTEANGAFNLVEKRVGVLHKFSGGIIGWTQIIERTGVDATDFDSTEIKDCSSVITSKGGKGACRCLNDTASKALCGNSDYTALTVLYLHHVSGFETYDERSFLVYCAPKKTELLVKTGSKTVNFKDYNGNFDCQFTFDEGWGGYNGILSDPLYHNEENNVVFTKSLLSNIDESANVAGTEFNPVMVLETGKSLESDFKYISNADTDKVFRLSCNKFSMFVDNEGDNMAWTKRIGQSSTFPTETPDFFKKAVVVLQRFGRSREDVPFGSAVLTSDYDLSTSEPVLLRNQYSKTAGETLFAGRPYGCSVENGVSSSGCSNIGQCNGDPNVFCIFRNGDADFNKKSCSAGGNGTCENMWNHPDSSTTETTAIANLNQIFVKKYADFIYSKSDNGYIGTKSTAYFYSGDDPLMGTLETATHTVTSVLNIKKIKPIIDNIDFRLFSSLNPIFPADGKVNTLEAGLYQLSFNTSIDDEQQPMKQIVVDWGDDSLQVITGLDNKPEVDTPHVFYHFYLKGAGRTLQVKIIDNWNTWKCLSMSGNTWNSSVCGL